jgi:hypothetical protein
MTHRIRHAMQSPGGLLVSRGGIVEADETYVGRKPGRQKRAGTGHKEAVFALVQRGAVVRSVHITGKTFAGVKRSLKANVSPDAVLMTDDARMYKKIAKQFADHKSVNHNHSAGEYVRGDAHTNQHHRGRVFDLQARYDGGVSASQLRPFAAAIPDGV